MIVRIGRSTGPCTDEVVESDFQDAEPIELIKDVLAMVNKVSGNKEGWFIQIGEEGAIIVPEVQ